MVIPSHTRLENFKKPNDFEHLLNQVEGCFFQIFYDTGLHTFTFKYVSEKAKDVYGISAKKLLIEPLLAFKSIIIQDQDEVRTTALASLNNLDVWKQDFRISKETDRISWVRIHATPRQIENEVILWDGYISDITHSKTVENELVKIKERFEFAIEGSEIGIWDWNLKANTVYYSDRSLAFLEMDRSSIKPHEDTWTNRVHPEDKESYFADIKEHFDGKTSHYSNDHRIFAASGVYKWIQDRGRTVEWDKNGKPVRMIGTHVDISKRKQREQTILDKNMVINSHNNRLKNFALIVSHNLRTHAGNFSDLLKLIEQADSQNEKEELSSYLRGISTGFSDTVANLEDIVTANAKLADKPKMIVVQQFVNNALRDLNAQIMQKSAIIRSDIPQDIEIKYNAAYFESILHNLISNALKYSHPDRVPQVIISVELVSENSMVLTVEDNGIGIDLEKNGKKLFGMYKTFHRNEDAKGLGLFMTKNQINDMGDEITVQSTLGKGSTFSVRFNNKLP